MKLNIGFVGTGSLNATLDVVKKAEQCGLNGVSFSEHTGFHDAIVPSAVYLHTTSDIEVIPLGISSAERHPAVLAMELSSLAELGPGRVRAQVGTGAPTMLRQICADMYHPIARTRSMVEVLRALLASKSLTGHFASGSFDKFQLRQLVGTNVIPAEKKHIPIDVMAIRPKMLRLAAQVGDGVVLTGGTSSEYLSYAVESLERELITAGRDRDKFRITALTFGVITPDYQQHYPILRLLLETYAPILAADTMRGVIDGKQYAFDRAVQSTDLESDFLTAIGERYFPPEVIEQLSVAAAGVDDLAKVLSRYASTGIDVLDVHLAGPESTHSYAVETLAAAIEKI